MPPHEETTTDRLVAHYNTYTRRPTVRDPETRELMFKSFRRTLGPWLPRDKGAAILDIGCGEGSFLTFMTHERYENLAGIDLSPENVAICHELGLDFVVQGDALQLESFEPDRSFELIVALDLLEHLPKEAASAFLEGARRRLAPSGSLVVQTPNMGCVYGHFHRYNDLTHEFSLTEKSAKDLFMSAGFRPENIDIQPAWNATTALGRVREVYLRILHRLVFLADDRSRPQIPTKNLLIRASAG